MVRGKNNDMNSVLGLASINCTCQLTRPVSVAPPSTLPVLAFRLLCLVANGGKRLAA